MKPLIFHFSPRRFFPWCLKGLDDRSATNRMPPSQPLEMPVDEAEFVKNVTGARGGMGPRSTTRAVEPYGL
jgi:hypothetical protein